MVSGDGVMVSGDGVMVSGDGAEFHVLTFFAVRKIAGLRLQSRGWLSPYYINPHGLYVNIYIYICIHILARRLG